MCSLSHSILLLCSFIVIHCVAFSYSQISNNKPNQIKCNVLINDFFESQIILFFAPLTTDRIKEQIVVYYHNRQFLKGADVVAIYETDSQTRGQNLIYSFEPSTKSGFKHTGISPLKLRYSVNSTFTKECLGYSGAWLRYGKVRKMTCLSTHPDWMSERKQILQNRTLTKLFIPGTHDSGSYSENPIQTLTEELTVTQDKDVLEQLISGVRYLDLRPAFYDEYWINHGSYQMNPMKNIINDVKEFLDNTEEIVILGFKEFYKGFDNDMDHIKFIKYLEKEFAGYYLPVPSTYEWDMTLGEIWKTGKRLILSYDHVMYKNRSSTWSSITQLWGNVQDLTALKNHLISAESMIIEPRASMAQITYDTWKVIKNSGAYIIGMKTSSLLKLGAMAGPYITQWYNELFYATANIVAVDVIDATGIVEVAIAWNDRRFSECYFLYLH